MERNRETNGTDFGEPSMNYQSIDLNISPEEAAAIIRSTDIDVWSRTQGNEIEFTTPGGYHVASLSPTSLPNGTRGARLRYRTVMIAPFAVHARRRARNIKAALVDYQVA